MSASLMLAFTCIFARSSASASVGVSKLMTVWPTSTCARHDHTVDGRDDVGVAEVDPRLLELGLGLLHLGLLQGDRARLVDAAREDVHASASDALLGLRFRTRFELLCEVGAP